MQRRLRYAVKQVDIDAVAAAADDGGGDGDGDKGDDDDGALFPPWSMNKMHQADIEGVRP